MCALTAWIRAHPASCGDALPRIRVKMVPTSIMTDDVGIFDIVSLSRHHHCSMCHLARAASGETIDLGLSDWMISAPLV